MIAAMEGHTETVKILVDGGADVNARNRGDNTALMIAVKTGHTDTVKVLIKAGADVNAKTPGGVTALVIAEIGNNHDGKMLQAKRLIKDAYEAGYIACHGACHYGFRYFNGAIEFLRKLVRYSGTGYE